MPRVVLTDKCVNCRSCVAVCPAAAFHDADDYVVINPDSCIDCGACEMTCPHEAIVEDDDPAAEAGMTAKNAEESAKFPQA